MIDFSINNFVLDKDVDVLSVMYAVAPSMSNLDQEQPQQTTYTTQYYTTYQYYIGTTYYAVLNIVGATEVGVVYWAAVAILAVAVLAVVPDVVT